MRITLVLAAVGLVTTSAVISEIAAEPVTPNASQPATRGAAQAAAKSKLSPLGYYSWETGTVGHVDKLKVVQIMDDGNIVGSFTLLIKTRDPITGELQDKEIQREFKLIPRGFPSKGVNIGDTIAIDADVKLTGNIKEPASNAVPIWFAEPFRYPISTSKNLADRIFTAIPEKEFPVISDVDAELLKKAENVKKIVEKLVGRAFDGNVELYRIDGSGGGTFGKHFVYERRNFDVLFEVKNLPQVTDNARGDVRKAANELNDYLVRAGKNCRLQAAADKVWVYCQANSVIIKISISSGKVSSAPADLPKWK